jgi:predicted MFS family arabinose efflux permease
MPDPRPLAVLAALAILLAACGPSKEERRLAFAERCKTAAFTAPQCAMLFDMAEDTRDANDAAEAGMALGASAAASAGAAAGSRR